jgi:hypothetical protein
VDGTEYWISAWTKTSKKGEKYQSLSVTRKEGQAEKSEPAAADDFNDDIPF